MANYADAKKVAYSTLLTLNEVTKSYINSILDSYGYSEDSEVKKESIARSRRNIFKDFVDNEFLLDKYDRYIITDKLKNVRDELKLILLKGDNSDIRNIVTKLNRSINNNNDRNMGFVTQYSLNSSFLENSIIEAKVRDCTLFLSLLSKMLEDDEEKKAS